MKTTSISLAILGAILLPCPNAQGQAQNVVSMEARPRRVPAPVRRKTVERAVSGGHAVDRGSAANWELAERQMAANKLRDFGQTALPARCELLKDNDADNRNTVLQVVGQIGPPAKEAAPFIAEVLHDKDWRLHASAAVGLGKLALMPSRRWRHSLRLSQTWRATYGSARSRPWAVSARRPRPRRPVSSSVCMTTSPQFVRPLPSAGQIGPQAKAAVPDLEKLRHDPQEYVRRAAGEALAVILRHDSRH